MCAARSARRSGSTSAAALGLHLRYAFEPGEQQGAALGNPLFELLAAVTEAGSIRHAAQTLGASYRYVWDSLRNWERTLGEPLITWSQGRRARPTEFALKLSVGRAAGARAHAAAHRGPALAILPGARRCARRAAAAPDGACQPRPRAAGAAAARRGDFGSAPEARLYRAAPTRCARSTRRNAWSPGSTCRGSAALRRCSSRTLKPLLKPRLHRLIACSQRMQGLMVRKEHAALVGVSPTSSGCACALRTASMQPQIHDQYATRLSFFDRDFGQLHHIIRSAVCPYGMRLAELLHLPDPQHRQQPEADTNSDYGDQRRQNLNAPAHGSNAVAPYEKIAMVSCTNLPGPRSYYGVTGFDSVQRVCSSVFAWSAYARALSSVKDDRMLSNTRIRRG